MPAIKTKNLFERKLTFDTHDSTSDFNLKDGSKVAVVGGGPAGSFFTYFLLDMAKRINLDIKVDMYEPRNFFIPGPQGCNHCGGIISETLVQNLASEGINLPAEIIQRGIDSYVMHTDTGNVDIETPLHEKRIGAVHRGSGPKDINETKWGSFDGYLQILAMEKGASLFQTKVDNILWENSKPQIVTRQNSNKAYDLVAVAVGVNTSSLRMLSEIVTEYKPPETTKTFIREYYFGESEVARYIGNSMHVFLVDIPKLEFAALIPKGDFVTLCMLGENINRKTIKSFMEFPQVKECFPPDFDPEQNACNCSPRINIKGSAKPYADRIVFIGDCGVNRLYKDGIGVSYRAAKAAATTAIFEGISATDFNRYYWPTCRKIDIDNTFGKLVFIIIGILQKFRFARLAIVRMIASEQKNSSRRKDMSIVLWDMFTGSSSYTEIFLRTLHPIFLVKYIWNLIKSFVYPKRIAS